MNKTDKLLQLPLQILELALARDLAFTSCQEKQLSLRLSLEKLLERRKGQTYIGHKYDLSSIQSTSLLFFYLVFCTNHLTFCTQLPSDGRLTLILLFVFDALLLLSHARRQICY